MGGVWGWAVALGGGGGKAVPGGEGAMQGGEAAAGVQQVALPGHLTE